MRSVDTLRFSLSVATAALVVWAAGCGPSTTASNHQDAGDGADAGCPVPQQCGDACCTDTQYCHNAQCLEVIGQCDVEPLCPEDARCIDGHCIPWSEFPGFDHDTGCTREVEPGVLRPQLQCAWESDPATDPDAAFYAIRHTPLVVDFHLGDVDVARGPSIVVVGREEYRGGDPGCPSRGPVTVLDGRTCEELYRTDAEDGPVLERGCLLHPDPVDERPETAAQVLDLHRLAADDEPGVDPGDLRVVEHDEVGGPITTDQGLLAVRDLDGHDVGPVFEVGQFYDHGCLPGVSSRVRRADPIALMRL